MSWTPPSEFDGYRLVRSLGRGRMGQVHLAEDTVLRRPVAVKFLSRIDASDGGRERMLVEARAIARIQHSNVVSIYRVGEIEGHPYLVSEYVRGEPLDRLARPVAPERALRIAIGLARGLAEAHRHGVLHRDIKPANAILSEEGEAKLLDFGLAKFTDDLGVPRAIRRTPQPLTVVPTARPTELASTLPSPEARRDAIVMASVDPLPGDAKEQTISLPAEIRGATVIQIGSSRPHELTREGAVIGTPLYMAPEAWRGELSTFRSDVYSLGALLHHLCVGRPVHERETLNDLREACLLVDPRSVSELAPHLDRGLALVIDRCLRREPLERFASGEALRQALEPLIPERQFAAIPEGNPYRGLYAFEAEHRGLFFGRDAEIRSVIESLRNRPFVLVAGDSGVGKSSLCRAAVLPAIREGGLRGGRAWKVASLVPGRRPVAALAASLAVAVGRDEKELVQLLEDDPQGVGRALRKAMGETVGVAIFADQLEEVLTVSEPSERALFGHLLGWLAEPAPGIALLATVRGDFLTRIASLPGIGEQVSRALFILRPMERPNIREAIVGPARATGVTFESDRLVEALADTTADAEGGLPLLQFALAELWEAREPTHKAMTEAALQRLGGVSGALARHADGVVQGLLPDQRASARRVLLELVTEEGTRARRLESELLAGDPASRPALDALVRSRLVVARDSDAGATLSVAHEALIRGWPMLREWIDKDVETRALRERLARAAAEWERLGKSAEGLWSARQLTEVSALTESLLPARSIAFLEQARALAARVQRRRRIALAMIPVGLAAAWGGFELKGRHDVRRLVEARATSADLHLQEARELQRQADAAGRDAMSRYDAQNLEDGDKAWLGVEAMRARANRQYAEGENDLEAALGTDPGNANIRSRFEDLLLERALVADSAGEHERTDDLLTRLRAYDATGQREAKFNQPSSLTLNVSPEPSHVQVVRLDPKTFAPLSSTDLTGSPPYKMDLAPGSYIVSASAPGRAEVRLPELVRRGEPLNIMLELPAQASVPEGFAYIPPGPALIGSSLPDPVRKGFLTTVPEHLITTGSFLMSRRETTYAQWILFLRSLPVAERQELLAGSDPSAFRGQVGLLQLEDGRFALHLEIGALVVTAAEGERIVFPGRRIRREVDWLQLPVAGVSYLRSQRYLHWLSETGRVPGARLCTEVEWERAARGADGRPYPNGDHLDPDSANFDETYDRDPLGMGPDEVGSHPGSQSPFGIDDLAGNLFELTQGAITKDAVVARGGSYLHGSFTALASNRQLLEAAQSDVTIGLRVCASVPK